MNEYLEPIFCTLPNEKHENRKQTKNTICITVSFWWCFFIREHLPRKETGIAQINFVCMYFYSHLHGFNLAWDRSYDGTEASQFDQL